MTEDLITDRTGPGSYDWRDYNRVQDAVVYLQDLLTTAGYAVEIVPMPTWTRADIPTLAQLKDYLANVHRLRDALSLNLKLPKSMSRINWVGANDIEKALLDIEELLITMPRIYKRAGSSIALSGLNYYPSATEIEYTLYFLCDSDSFALCDSDGVCLTAR